MPDRHIFEVTADGAAQPTGATAPPEPSRAIATPRASVTARCGSASAKPVGAGGEAQAHETCPPAETSAGASAAELGGAASAIALPAPDEKINATPAKKAGNRSA